MTVNNSSSFYMETEDSAYLTYKYQDWIGPQITEYIYA